VAKRIVNTRMIIHQKKPSLSSLIGKNDDKWRVVECLWRNAQI